MKTLDKIRQIFWEAVEKETQQERENYLDEVCQDNPSLRAEIDTLLKAHYGQDDLLSGPLLGSPVAPADSPLSESPGTVIDKYKLLEKIGEGGMAVVYMADILSDRSSQRWSSSFHIRTSNFGLLPTSSAANRTMSRLISVAK